MRGRRGLWVGLGLVVVVQLVAAVGAFLPAPHSGGDNAGYVALADALLEGRGYVEAWDPSLPPHTKYPPVFPALLAVAVALGAGSWASLKWVATLATVAAAALTFLWARERRGSVPFAAAVATLVALAPAVVTHAHWILSDPPFVAFTLLALWACERAGRGGAVDEADGARGGDDGAHGVGGAPGEGAVSAPWLVLGCAAALLAYFTRSAGLPLLVAVAGWLALRKRWAWAGGFAAAAAVPAVAWLLRGRGGGEARYGTEFWMVDPYDPSLGTIAPVDLVARASENLVGYVGSHVPVGLAGLEGAAGGLLGLALFGLAAVGWGRRVARGLGRGRGGDDGVGVAELFAPLYLGLILLWPPVWSGDRFALPLLPLLLFYAGETVLELGRRASPRVAAGAAAVAALLVALPALSAWTDQVEQNRACAAAVEAAGPWACWGGPFVEFAGAARWSSERLPYDAVVLTRKPRIFYALSGLPGRTYPFLADADALLAEADALGARYVVLDFIGSQGPTYVGAALRSRPGAFCVVQGFSAGAGGPGTQLLGIRPPGARGGPGGVEAEGIRLSRCPAEYSPGASSPPPDREIPILGMPIR